MDSQNATNILHLPGKPVNSALESQSIHLFPLSVVCVSPLPVSWSIITIMSRIWVMPFSAKLQSQWIRQYPFTNHKPAASAFVKLRLIFTQPNKSFKPNLEKINLKTHCCDRRTWNDVTDRQWNIRDVSLFTICWHVLKHLVVYVHEIITIILWFLAQCCRWPPTPSHSVHGTSREERRVEFYQ